MSANLNPNLFRLSLPEWLKEQVESGNHKGVFWIDEEEKIFHVPWKHASRNGWEDGDVSLFKAWAIYTNRYREGIDQPRPALWKTNFRCAINSHNYISFMKDQGQRKGDKAHRIMKLMGQPNKDCKSKPVDSCNNVEPLRKRVRITYPSSSDQSRKRLRATYTNPMSKTNGKIDFCDYCRNEKLANSESCGNCNSIKRFKIGSATMSRNSDHEYLTNSNRHFFMENKDCNISNNSETLKPKIEIKKPNLQDLYFVGKALQSIDDPSIGLDISIRTNFKKLQSGLIRAQKVKHEIGEDDATLNGESTPAYMGINESNCDYLGDTNIKSSNESEEDGDDDELITPRNS